MSRSLPLCYFLLYMALAAACTERSVKQKEIEKELVVSQVLEKPHVLFLKQNPDFQVDGFDFPVGKPEGRGYYNAQPFGNNTHLGDDWNALTGGNTDLGDPIYAIANGYVHTASSFGGGWGKVIRIIHHHPNLKPPYVESLYAHCDSILVIEGQGVKKGGQIGTIGNAGGIYLAHLHLEIRDSVEWPLGAGYGTDRKGYLDPTAFIQTNRRVD